MIDLYISKEIYEGHVGQDDLIGKLIACRNVSIFLDMTDCDLNKYLDILDKDLSKRTVSMDRGRNNIKSGKLMVDKVRKGKKVKYGLTKAIFIINSNPEKDDSISEEDRKEIQSKYGVLCIDENDENLLKLICTGEGERSKTPEKGENASAYGDWDFYFKKFQSIPCTSLFFCDHYIKNDKPKFENFKRIISNFMRCTGIKKPFQLLIVCGNHGGEDRRKFHDEIINNINNVLLSVSKSKHRQINVEYIYCQSDDDLKLYTNTHDRHGFSNYVSLTYLHQINAFKYNSNPVEDEYPVEAECCQEIYTETIFSKNIDSIDKDTPEVKSEKYLRAARYDFDNIKPWGNCIDDKITYQYFIINGENVVQQLNDTPSIKNNLLMENPGIKDGEQCYYLSVRNKNDWANIVREEGTFIYKNYEKCIVVNKGHTKILNNYIKQIQNLFKNHKCTPATEEDNVFYRIVVTDQSKIKTVHVESSDKNELKAQQRNYPHNNFKNRYDAIKIANQIAEICGFKRTYRDD